MLFFIQYYCPIVQTDQNSQFYLYALSLFAGSGSTTLVLRTGFELAPVRGGIWHILEEGWEFSLVREMVGIWHVLLEAEEGVKFVM